MNKWIAEWMNEMRKLRLSGGQLRLSSLVCLLSKEGLCRGEDSGQALLARTGKVQEKCLLIREGPHHPWVQDPHPVLAFPAF